MKNKDKTKGQLLNELVKLRQRIAELEKSETVRNKRAEGALHESEERYRLLVETMNDGLGVENENGLITYANDKLCEL